jgi:hypothetical protein
MGRNIIFDFSINEGVIQNINKFKFFDKIPHSCPPVGAAFLNSNNLKLIIILMPVSRLHITSRKVSDLIFTDIEYICFQGSQQGINFKITAAAVTIWCNIFLNMLVWRTSI